MDLSGWELTAGVGFEFPSNATIGANALLLIAENPAALDAEFGYSGALGPWTGKLRNSGETLTLRDQGGTLISRADYKLGFPWPTVGDTVGSPAASPSIQLIHPLFDTELGGSWRSAAPTPGAQNSVYATQAPPQTRQVGHTPKQPASGKAVVIQALVTDPDGVASVSLSYQTVNPGDYFCRYLKFNTDGTTNLDARYENPLEWTAVTMADDGLGGDQLASDGVDTVTLPGTLQVNRRLVRYRISVEDTAGNSVTVPYADDPQPNFACFVCDGTPDWSGAIRSGDTAVNHSGALMSSIPTYTLLSTAASRGSSRASGSVSSNYGVEACKTHYAQFYVVDNASPAGANQYEGG